VIINNNIIIDYRHLCCRHSTGCLIIIQISNFFYSCLTTILVYTLRFKVKSNTSRSKSTSWWKKLHSQSMMLDELAIDYSEYLKVDNENEVFIGTYA